MKKIVMALMIVGLVQISAEAQTKSCSCQAKRHHVTRHHLAYRHTKTMHPLVYRTVRQTANDEAMATSTVPPTVPVAKAKNELVPDNLSAIGTPTVYKEKVIVWTGDQNSNNNNNVNLAPTSSRRATRTSPCRSINYAANNRVHAYAGYRRHNIIVNDDMNNPYQGEPSKQNDGVRKNEQRNINAYQTSMVLPGNDGSRP